MRPRLGVLPFLALLASVGVSAQNDPQRKAQASLGPAPATNSGGVWSTVAQTTTERWEAGVVALNGKIYVLGGGKAMPGQQNFPLAQEFDPATGHWRDLAPLPQGASHLDAIALNGKIYVAGGFSWSNHRNPIDLFLEYDPATDQWKQLTRLSSPRGSVSLVVVGGMIHAIAGTGGDFRVAGTHEVFNPATGVWTPAAPLLTPRDHLGGIIAVDGKLHIFGGRWTGSSQTSVAMHDVYDPATDKWTSAAPLPAPRSEGAVVSYHGLILYFGGDCYDPKATGPFDDLQAYDPATDRWKPLAKAPLGLHGQGAAVVGDAVYFIGGGMSCLVATTTISNSVLAFRLP